MKLCVAAVLLGFAAAAPAPPVEKMMSMMSSMGMDSHHSHHDTAMEGSGSHMTMGMGMSMGMTNPDMGSGMETMHEMPDLDLGTGNGGEMVEVGEFAGMMCSTELQAIPDEGAGQQNLNDLTSYCMDLLSDPDMDRIDADTDEDEEMTGVCDCHPGSISFTLGTGDCDATTNWQAMKFECSDIAQTQVKQGGVEVTSTDADITYADGVYTMSSDGRLGAQTDITILSGGAPAQSLSLHTSCSQPFGTGDVFGAITITGFTCSASGGHGMGSMGHSMMHSHGHDGGDGGCDCHPEGLQFRYIGGGCDATTFDQSGKLECSGASASGQATFTCESGDTFTVNEGDTFTLDGNLGAQTDCTIASEGGTQELSIHTSCSGGLYAGDVYGSVEVVAWDCGDGYSPGSEEGGTVDRGQVLAMCAPYIAQDEQCRDFVAPATGQTAEPEWYAAMRCMCGIFDLPEPVTLLDNVQPMPNAPVDAPDMGPEFSFFSCSIQDCPTEMGVCGPEMMPTLVTNGDGPCFSVSGGAPGCPMCVDFRGQEVCSDPMPSGCCPASCPLHLGVVVRYIPPVMSCECHPDAMSFTYIGGGCDQSNNEQGGKFECSGGSPSGPATISCDSGDVYENVNIGDVFVLGNSRLGAQTDCTVTSGGASQTLSIHTSCSQGLYSSDIFGAVEVVTWDCGSGFIGSVMPDEPVEEQEVCNCHPECLEFTYAGNDCTSTHDQGGKLGCEGAVSGDVTISGDTTVSTLSEGDVVGVGCMGTRLGAQSDVTLTDSEGSVQSLSLHTSCSQRLAVGDTYGALTVSGFSCGENGGSGSMMGSHGSMMGSHSNDAEPEAAMGRVMISFFADGELVGAVEEIAVADGGIMTCDEQDALVGDSANEDDQMGNTVMYPLAVPDIMVPSISDTAECLPSCINLPDNLLDQFVAVAPAEGESCPSYEPVGLCTFDPLCSFYSTPRPEVEGRPARQPYVPASCLTCNCGEDTYCPYDSGEVDSLGRPLCGQGQNDCISDPDPPVLSYCPHSGDGDTVGTGSTVVVDVCSSEQLVDTPILNCNGVDFGECADTSDGGSPGTTFRCQNELTQEFANQQGALVCELVEPVHDRAGNPQSDLGPQQDCGGDECGLVIDVTVDPLVCLHCDSDNGDAQFGGTCVLQVEACSEEIVMADRSYDCTGMTLDFDGCTFTDGVGRCTYSGVVGFDNHPDLDRQGETMECDIVPSDVTDLAGNAAEELGSGVCADDEPVCGPPIDVVFPSPSPSPSTQPIYQVQMFESRTLCITDPCVVHYEWDNYTTRINIWYERAIIDTATGQAELYQPPISELTFMPDMDSIELYALTQTQCYNPPESLQCQRSQNPILSEAQAERLAQYCLPCVNDAWVPLWFVTDSNYVATVEGLIEAGTDYHPKPTAASVYPNAQPHDAIAGVVDCSVIHANELFANLASIKFVMFPMGPTRTNPDGSIWYDDEGNAKGGPCWFDPDYQETVCANGGGGLPPGTLDWPSDTVPFPKVRNIDGENYPQTTDQNGQYPRQMQFNCPRASGNDKIAADFAAEKLRF